MDVRLEITDALTTLQLRVIHEAEAGRVWLDLSPHEEGIGLCA